MPRNYCPVGNSGEDVVVKVDLSTLGNAEAYAERINRRCAAIARVGCGEYQCELDKGHEGEHEASTYGEYDTDGTLFWESGESEI